MTLSRRAFVRISSALILSLVVAACGAAGATTLPGNTPGAPTPAAPAATPAAATPAPASVAPSLAASTAASVAAGGVPDCSGSQIGRKAFTMSGFEAQRYCGPATASVTVGGATTQFSSGWCETNAAGFSVAIGTQLFGSPDVSQEPDLFIVLVDPTTGDGPISGVANHHGFLLVTPPLTFGPGKKSGTFSGTAEVGGAISGSFTCNN
jgi:hypothetical protein